MVCNATHICVVYHGATRRAHALARRLGRHLLGARQASHSAPIRRPAQADNSGLYMQHATGYVHGFGSAPQCGPPTHTEPLIVMRLSTHSQELSQTDAFRHYQAGLDGNVITTKALCS